VKSSETSVPGRLPTHIVALDQVLGGGIPAYSTCIVAGAPGTGKTILAQQILFANATPSTKSLYMTTVSEPAAKVVRYQQQFSFFDPAKIGEELVYMDLGEIIRDQGPIKSLDVIIKVMQDYAPRQLAIDSFRALHDLIPEPQTFRRFVFELAVKFGSWSTTAFLIGEYSREEVNALPEFATADSIINLTVETPTGAARRYLEVLKMRGGDYMSGKHLFKITENGIELFPRKFVAAGESFALGVTRVPTGISELDNLLEGGYREKSVIAVTGSAGTGKTLLGLQFICDGAQSRGEPGVYFTFEESEGQLEAFAESFGWNVKDLTKRKLLKICYSKPLDLSPEEQLLKISGILTSTRAKRAVIDSLAPLLGGKRDESEIRELSYQMALLLKGTGVTSLVVSDVPVGSERISRFGPEESVFDGIIILKNQLRDARRERFIEVYKMRGTRHVTGDQRFRITDRGIVVFPKPGEGEQYGE